MADPINPNNATVQYAGYLADYTQHFIAVFNVEGELYAIDDTCTHQDASLSDGWLEGWRALDPDPDAMDRVNPLYIPRNHLVEEALLAATDGDHAPLHALLGAVQQPFDPRPGLVANLEEAKRKDAAEEQQEAIRELEQAKAELEKILRQLREEELERMLVMLEARFRKMLDEVTPEARMIGAVNTIKNDAGKLSGYNTDVLGWSEVDRQRANRVGRQAGLLRGSLEGPFGDTARQLLPAGGGPSS